jgi:hypothetical protein
MNRIFIIVLLLFMQLGTSAQVSFESALDTNRILIGQQVDFRLTAGNVSPEQSLIWPQWPDTLSKAELIAMRWDTTAEAGLRKITATFTLTSFDSGFVVLPPFQLISGSDTLYSEPKILNVNTVSFDPEIELYDIKEPLQAPIDWWYWIKKLWWIALAVASAIALIWWLWSKRKRTEPGFAVPKDGRTPAERATDALNELRDRKVWQNGDVKKYYSELTEIIRRYIEESEGVPALEMISDELIEAIQIKYAATEQRLLSGMLKKADAVKFAKAKPGPDEHLSIWDSAVLFVQNTSLKKAADEV